MFNDIGTPLSRAERSEARAMGLIHDTDIPDANAGLDRYLDRVYGGQSAREMEEHDARVQRLADDMTSEAESCFQFVESLINDDRFERLLVQALYCHKAGMPVSRDQALYELWAIIRDEAYQRAERQLR